MTDSIFKGLGETITVERPSGPVTLVKGRAVPPGSPTTLTIDDVSVQPLRPEELQEFEELERTSDARKFYLETELFTVDQETKTGADIIIWNSKKWKVISVENHSEGILDHFKVIAQRTTKS